MTLYTSQVPYISKVESFQLVNSEGAYLRQNMPSYTRPLWFKPRFRSDGVPESGFDLIGDAVLIAQLEAQYQIALTTGKWE